VNDDNKGANTYARDHNIRTPRAYANSCAYGDFFDWISQVLGLNYNPCFVLSDARKDVN